VPDRDLIYQGHILTLSILEDKWEIVEHAEAVAVLVTRGKEVLGVVQRRPAVGQDTWEIPAGLIDEGESPETAARRELAEEAQLTGELELLTQFYSSPGFTDEKIYLFRATHLSPATGTPDEGEALTLSWRDIETLWEDVRAGRVASSGPSLLALSLARAYLRDA